MPAGTETKRFDKTFEECGIAFSQNGSTNLHTDCPFCGKEGHLYMNPRSGQWDCKHCLEKGNHYTFLTRFYDQLFGLMQEGEWNELSELRKGIPAEFFQSHEKGIACAKDGDNWLIPTHGIEGQLLNLYRWGGPGTHPLSSANCTAHLFREHTLRPNVPSLHPIYVCEGPWDTVALCWLQALAGFPGTIVGVPGANTFKDQWLPLFKGTHVVLLYDNDKAGSQGMISAATKLQGVAKSVSRIHWPAAAPEKYDVDNLIRDRLLKEGKKPKKYMAVGAWKELQSLLKPVAAASATQHSPVAAALGAALESVALPQRKRSVVKYTQLIREWKKNYHLDKNMIDALQVVLAAALSVNLSGDPLWMFLVGPPGSGKTAMLLTLSGSELVQYESSLTPHNLVSGFKSQDGTDSSLLPLWNRKCVVLKDYTEIIAQPKQMQEEIYGTLRGAFDGRVEKRFGNGQHRCYTDLYFSLVAGVTDVIHGDERATLGERFLKFEFLRGQDRTGYVQTEDQIRSAVRGLDREFLMEERLRVLASDFIYTIEQKLQPPAHLTIPAATAEVPSAKLLKQRHDWFRKHTPQVPKWVEDRVVALAQIIAYLRAGVVRHRDGDISYRARPEVATRLAKQLTKLGKSLCLLHGKKTIDKESYRLMERTAFDTAVAWNVEIVQELVKHYPKPIPVVDLAQTLQIPVNTIRRRIDNLQELRAVIRERLPVAKNKNQKLPGQPPFGYQVTPQLRELWKAAKVFSH